MITVIKNIRKCLRSLWKIEKTIVFKCPYYERCQDQDNYALYQDMEDIKLVRLARKCEAPFLKIKYKRSPVCVIVLDKEGVENWHLIIEDLTLFKQPKKNPRKNPVRKKK